MNSTGAFSFGEFHSLPGILVNFTDRDSFNIGNMICTAQP